MSLLSKPHDGLAFKASDKVILHKANKLFTCVVEWNETSWHAVVKPV